MRRLPAQRLIDGANLLLPPVRDQGAEGSCTAMALANVIDVLRLSENDTAAPVSPRMLFEMASAQQGRPGEEPGFHSLRPVVKAFYHNGVCLESDWPYAPTGAPEDRRLTVARAKAAHNVILGAYFRVPAYLDDYHAALNETGALLVAANTHANWQTSAVRRMQGRILPGSSAGGGHAFVLVGYDADGFLVFNSWGEGWGGFGGRPGVAHWSYEDWADSAVDAWVLRLAVSTPRAFPLTIGENGLTVLAGSIARGSARRAALTGHYAHLDDGQHVQSGNYPSSRDLVEETVRLLQTRSPGRASGGNATVTAPEASAGRRYGDILIRFAAASQDLEHLVRKATASVDQCKDRGFYPFWLFWCHDHTPAFRAALSAIIQAVLAEVGEPGPVLDAMVEERVRGLGRAVWRDVKESARRAMADTGDGYHLVLSLSRLCAESGIRLHLVSEGEGIFPLAAMVETAARAGDLHLVRAPLASLRMVAPTCTPRFFRTTFSPLLDRGEAPDVPVVVDVPSPAFERRMRIGAYGGSYLRLVACALEDRNEDGGAAPLLGVAPSSLQTRGGAEGAPWHIKTRRVQPPADVAGPLDMNHLLDRCQSPGRVRKRTPNASPKQRALQQRAPREGLVLPL